MLAAVIFISNPTSISAQSLRCNGDIVNVGDMRAAVLQRCGEPVAKDSFCKPVDPKSVKKDISVANVAVMPFCQNVDQWTYNPGYGQFMTILQFEGDTITTIKYGDRVK
jgi:hypothetical protein